MMISSTSTFKAASSISGLLFLPGFVSVETAPPMRKSAKIAKKPRRNFKRSVFVSLDARFEFARRDLSVSWLSFHLVQSQKFWRGIIEAPVNFKFDDYGVLTPGHVKNRVNMGQTA